MISMKKNYLPHYLKSKKLWKVSFPDRQSEEGDLLYVASEFARTGLYFQYHTSETTGKEYSAHDHFFEGVIKALLADPTGFTVEGFEEYYSKQELEMLQAVQKRLLELNEERISDNYAREE